MHAGMTVVSSWLKCDKNATKRSLRVRPRCVSRWHSLANSTELPTAQCCKHTALVTGKGLACGDGRLAEIGEPTGPANPYRYHRAERGKGLELPDRRPR